MIILKKRKGRKKSGDLIKKRDWTQVGFSTLFQKEKMIRSKVGIAVDWLKAREKLGQ